MSYKHIFTTFNCLLYLICIAHNAHTKACSSSERIQSDTSYRHFLRAYDTTSSLLTLFKKDTITCNQELIIETLSQNASFRLNTMPELRDSNPTLYNLIQQKTQKCLKASEPWYKKISNLICVGGISLVTGCSGYAACKIFQKHPKRKKSLLLVPAALGLGAIAGYQYIKSNSNSPSILYEFNENLFYPEQAAITPETIITTPYQPLYVAQIEKKEQHLPDKDTKTNLNLNKLVDTPATASLPSLEHKANIISAQCNTQKPIALYISMLKNKSGIDPEKDRLLALIDIAQQTVLDDELKIKLYTDKDFQSLLQSDQKLKKQIHAHQELHSNLLSSGLGFLQLETYTQLTGLSHRSFTKEADSPPDTFNKLNQWLKSTSAVNDCMQDEKNTIKRILDAQKINTNLSYGCIASAEEKKPNKMSAQSRKRKKKVHTHSSSGPQEKEIHLYHLLLTNQDNEKSLVPIVYDNSCTEVASHKGFNSLIKAHVIPFLTVEQKNKCILIKKLKTEKHINSKKYPKVLEQLNAHGPCIFVVSEDPSFPLRQKHYLLEAMEFNPLFNSPLITWLKENLPQHLINASAESIILISSKGTLATVSLKETAYAYEEDEQEWKEFQPVLDKLNAFERDLIQQGKIIKVAQETQNKFNDFLQKNRTIKEQIAQIKTNKITVSNDIYCNSMHPYMTVIT